jgi:outer membrane usher protein
VANDAAPACQSLDDWRSPPAVARKGSLLAFPRLFRPAQGCVGAVLPSVAFARAAEGEAIVAGGNLGDEVAEDAASTAIPSGAAAPAAPAARINPTKRDLHFIVPVTDGDTFLGEVELTVSPRDELSVQSDRMLQLLQPLLKAEAFRTVSAKVQQGRPLPAALLASEGVSLNYDPAKLSLALAIGLDKREGQTLGLRNSGGLRGESISPAGFSGFLTVRAATDVVEHGMQPGVMAPTAELDSGLNLKGLVLENQGYVSARSGDPAFRRSGSRLVYEDLTRKVRLTLGDTFVQAQRFQASPSVLGLGISRRYAELDPQREVRASGSQQFSVAGASTVETFVNGRSVERRNIGPGNYTLRDFPLAEGSNQVRLRIEDATGAVRVIEFSAYANQALLARGLTEFSVVGGVFSSPTRTGFSYDRRWVASGFVRRGVSDTVTLGGNFQATADVQQGGVQVLWGAPLGLIGFDLSASTRRGGVQGGGGQGLAAALTYERLLTGGGESNTALRGAVEVRSKRFEIPEVAFGPKSSEIHASVGLIRSFSRDRFIALDGRFDRNRLTGRNWGLQASGGMPLSERFTLLAEAGWKRGSQREAWVRTGLRVRLGQRGLAQSDISSRGEISANVSSSGGRATAPGMRRRTSTGGPRTPASPQAARSTQTASRWARSRA